MVAPNISAPVFIHDALPLSPAEAKCVNWRAGAKITFVCDEVTGQVNAVLAETAHNLEIFCTRKIWQQLRDKTL